MTFPERGSSSNEYVPDGLSHVDLGLVRVGSSGNEIPAVVHDGVAYDVSNRIGDFDDEFWMEGGFSSITAILTEHKQELPRIDLTKHRLAPPVARPRKLICVGMNYVDHAQEAGVPPPSEPVLFMKPTNTIVGPFDDLLIPPDSSKTDYEVELSLVIARPARYLSNPDEAVGVVGGYTIANDVSERDYQLERGGQWVKGKSCETFNPLGPFLAPPSSVESMGNLGLTLAVNGETRQQSSTSWMVFDVPYLVWYISQFMVLEPGDVINTGTPSGVALGMKSAKYLQAGDIVELAISGLGYQRQVCKQAVR